MITPGYEKIEGRWRKAGETKRCPHCQKTLALIHFSGSKQYCKKCTLNKRKRDRYTIKVGKMCPLCLAKTCSSVSMRRK